MSVVFGLDKMSLVRRGSAVAVGVFDGVHWGHQAIFHRLTEVATALGVESIALTFDRHPSELLSPAHAPNYITTLDQRIELIENSGVDTVLVAEFGTALASLSREEFLHRVLRDKLRADHVVVGSNFVFGKGRTGDVRYLQSEGRFLRMGVSIVSSVIIDGSPASSTRIRRLLGAGSVEDAARLLGRVFVLRAKVVHGDHRGRRLGFPTANLEVQPGQALPGQGVYEVETDVDGIRYAGVCSIGTNPTFRRGMRSVEVHLMSYQGDLYGRVLDVAFNRRLRDQLTFETPELLIEQIKSDIEQAQGGSRGKANPGLRSSGFWHAGIHAHRLQVQRVEDGYSR